MHMVVVDSAVQDFWVPVAQIVPVFALAIVLEARRSAAHWTVRLRAERWAAGIYYVGTAAMLVAIETLAIGSMETGQSLKSSVEIAGPALLLVMILVVMGAVFDVMLSGVADLVLFAPRILVSLIPKYRRRRKQVRKWRAVLISDMAETAAINEDASAQLKAARKQRRRVRRQLKNMQVSLKRPGLSSTVEAKMRVALAGLESLELRSDTSVDKLRGIVDRGRLRQIQGAAALVAADEYLRMLTLSLTEAEIKKLEDDWARFKTP
jgi:hypothetical protein